MLCDLAVDVESLGRESHVIFALEFTTYILAQFAVHHTVELLLLAHDRKDLHVAPLGLVDAEAGQHIREWADGQ